MSTITFSQEQPDTPEARALIDELDHTLAALYPPDSQYGLSIERLLEEKVSFFVLRYDGFPAGCGGVKCFGTEYAELKRMYVRPNYQGMGLGKKMLKYLEAYVQTQRISVIRLETGIFQEPAIRLYQRMGYQQIAPFGDYTQGPLNLFFEKWI